MVCDKCGFGYMVDDSHRDIKVFKCWVCGNRLYVDHPKRRGALVCARCGDVIDEENELNYCAECLRLLAAHTGRMHRRTYGESICRCGAIFVRKSPTQAFHSKDCRKRVGALLNS